MFTVVPRFSLFFTIFTIFHRFHSLSLFYTFFNQISPFFTSFRLCQTEFFFTVLTVFLFSFSFHCFPPFKQQQQNVYLMFTVFHCFFTILTIFHSLQFTVFHRFFTILTVFHSLQFFSLTIFQQKSQIVT